MFLIWSLEGTNETRRAFGSRVITGTLAGRGFGQVFGDKDWDRNYQQFLECANSTAWFKGAAEYDTR